jgi:hypothetical protein
MSASNGYHSNYGKFTMTMAQAFPNGAFLTGGVEASKDYDRSAPGRFVQAVDRDTGLSVWLAEVQSGDQMAPAWLRRAKVKILSDQEPPLPPPIPGTPFRPVEFDELIVTPYVDDSACKPAESGKQHRCRARVAYSVKAIGVRAPRSVAKSTAPAGGTAGSGPAAGAP